MKTALPPTKPGAAKLSDIARHVVAPKGVVSTGWPAVRDKCATLGITFRPWQPDVGRLILAKRANGKYAATIGGTGMSIPRQVGKTFIVGAIVFALCMLFPKLTVIWTAHRLRTAEETFGKMQTFAKRIRVRPHVAKIVLGSGEEEILFENGSRILFGARERGFGRGFDEVDVLIFDEAQILTESALDDMIPATNQSRQAAGALLLFMGTPPKPKDPGEVFARMRSEALSGEDADTGWIEFGADTDYRPTAPPAQLTAADWAQVAKANPSFPDDTPREAILRMRKKLGPESYLREGLGIWDEEDTAKGDIDLKRWALLADRNTPAPMGVVAWALAVPRDRSVTTLAAVWRAESGRLATMVTVFTGGSVVQKLKELAEEKKPIDISLHAGGPAGSLVADLGAAGVEVRPVTTQASAQATGALMDLIDNSGLVHLDQTELNNAVGSARLRNTGDAQYWDQRDLTDISPLAAVTLAVQGFTAHESLDYDPMKSFW